MKVKDTSTEVFPLVRPSRAFLAYLRPLIARPFKFIIVRFPYSIKMYVELSVCYVTNMYTHALSRGVGGEDAAMIKKCLDFSGTASGGKVSTTKSAGGCQGKKFWVG